MQSTVEYCMKNKCFYRTIFSEKIEPGPSTIGKNKTFFLTLKLFSKISTGIVLPYIRKCQTIQICLKQ